MGQHLFSRIYSIRVRDKRGLVRPIPTKQLCRSNRSNHTPLTRAIKTLGVIYRSGKLRMNCRRKLCLIIVSNINDIGRFQNGVHLKVPCTGKQPIHGVTGTSRIRTERTWKVQQDF